MRFPTRTCLLLLAAGLCAGATAANVYQWKDDKGVTHSSDSPPTGQKYDTRHIDNAGQSVEAEAAPAQAPSAQCLQARSNLATLASGSPVQQDSDGDGKPDKTLSDEERASHKSLSEAAVKAFCPPAG